jgi:hypothetical protein
MASKNLFWQWSTNGPCKKKHPHPVQQNPAASVGFARRIIQSRIGFIIIPNFRQVIQTTTSWGTQKMKLSTASGGASSGIAS